MKHILLALAILCLENTVSAQISVTATAGTPGPTSYTTVKASFDAINGGTHQGVITIAVTANTTETLSASLNASGSGLASYTGITISPSGGAARTISGSIASNGLIKLNGADNVTIDGLNTGSNSLIISNTSTSGVSILFTNDATSNTITNCTVKGVNISSFNETTGVISFGNAAASGTGNDNNTISYTNICDGSTTPYIGIWGYNSTAATFNDNITISHCNIYNFYFDAASGQISSSGIFTYDGNSGWTITDNNFYQTSSRTPTNPSVLNAIYLRTPAGSGFTITNNYIGGSAADHTGTWTSSTSSAATSYNAFVPILLDLGSTLATSLQNNTIANINYTTGGYDNTYGKFIGINATSTTKANIGNITGNIIGSDAGNSITIGGGVYCAVKGISYGGLGDVSISNNKVSGITVTSSTSGSFTGINVTGAASAAITVSNNLVGSTTQANSINISSSSNTMTTYGIFVSTGNVTTVSNNTVTNLYNASIGQVSFTGMYISGGTVVDVLQNTISKLSNSVITASGFSYALTGLTVGSANATINVTGNTIHTLKQVNASSTGSGVMGMNFSGSGSTFYIDNNFVHSLSNPNLTGVLHSITGMNVVYGTMHFRNNMIRLGYDETGTNINASPILDAIYISSGTESLYFYNNTVYVGGSFSGAATRDQMCFRGSSTRPMILKNNIFVNTRALTTPGSAVSGCIELSASSVCDGPNAANITNASTILDNNLYYFSGNATCIARSYTTLTAWQNYTRQEYNSLLSDPKLKTPTGTSATVDLHIDNALATAVEGAGVNISELTTDYDGEAISTLTPTDIGADAGNFTGNDIYAPGITYSLLSYKGAVGDRTLSNVQFFDPNGIASGANAPRIYYKKNAGTWFSTAGSLISSTTNSAIYDLTITAANVGGIVSGDVIYYYVVAEENTGGYLSSRPAGVVGTNVNTITTAPGTLYSYVASSSMSGTYSIGASQSAPYNTIYNALTAYSAAMMTGPVVFELTDATYAFGSTIAVISYNSDASATNTFTLRPAAGVSPVVTGTCAGAMIQLKGADYVTIDGSNNGTTSQDLTFINNTSGGSLIQLANGSTCVGNGATYNTIKNTILKGGNTTSGYGISIGSTTAGSVGDDHDYNTITNNLIQKVGNGIWLYSSTSGYSNNNTISNNTIGSATITDYVGMMGMHYYGLSASTISGNTIFNIINSTTQPAGIELNGWCTSNVVEKNIVYAVKTTAALNGATGIRVLVSSTGNTIRTNLIFDIGGTGSSVSSLNYIAGIYNSGTTNVYYYNTVYLAGDYNGNSTNANISTAFYNDAASTTGVDVRNNIFYNAIDPSGSNTAAKTYDIYLASIPATINYNDYFVAGQNPVLGYSVADQATIAAWRTATSQDLNSVNTNPSFVNAGGTVATDYLPSDVSLVAVSLAGITTDYAGTARGSSYSSMGIYEYTVNAPITVTATAGTTSANYVNVKAAFDAINLGTHQGVITIAINQSVTEYAAAVLNASGAGSASYTSVNIYPTTTGLTVSGNLATPLIDLNGANNVTLDGRVNATGSTKDLIITNTSAVATAGTSTIRFTNDASTNTVKYCTIKGSSIDPAAGILFFNSTTATTGNDGNTIDNNNITNAADLFRPLNAIYSAGTVSKTNSGNTISNNNIYDFFNRGTASNGINIAANNTGWTISTNNFYETASFVPTGAVAYSPINVSAITSTDIAISGNFIGGNAASCGGTAWTKTNAYTNTFYAINLNVGPTVTTTTTVQGNTIQNFVWGDAGASSWTAINIPSTATGAINIGTVTANSIGTTTGTGSVTVTAAATGGNVYGINIGGTGTVDCQNNLLGSITAANASTLGTNFYGINKTATTGTTTISNNIIGSTTTANSINASSTATANAQVVYGISSAGTGIVTISGNTISKLTNSTSNTTAATAGLINGIYVSAGTNSITNNLVHDLTISNANSSATNTASASGIVINNATAAAQTISANTIYNITNTYTSFVGYIVGLYFSGTTTASTVSGNFIYGLSVDAGSANANLYGIKIAAGATTYSNNIVTLGGNTNSVIIGIYETGASGHNNNLYFNTVYIGGSPATSARTYALYSAVNTNARNFSNNIFYNARSTANQVSNWNYAAFIVTAGGTITCNYNDYYFSGTAGQLGYYGTFVSTLPIVTGQDASSFSINPAFASAGGTIAANYLPSASTLVAVPIAGITTDYAGTTRGTSYTSMGIYEYTVNAPITLTATAGTASASYFNVKAAFDAINLGTHQGVITMAINQSVTESAAAILNASGAGSASYTSINIYPTITGLMISGNLATPLIDLNGADNVTIDGRVNATGSTKDLIITNTSTAATAGTSTIRFINDATLNIVKYCTLKGSTTSTVDGVLMFSTTTGTTGNDGNTIDNNNITNSLDANRPLNAIYSVGTAAKENSSNTVSNNNVYDFLNRSTASNGIQLAANNTGWTIRANSYYETASFVPTAAVAYNVIYINNTSGIDFTISNNFIGGSAASCGGTAWTKTNGNGNTFTGIYLNVGTATASNVQGNTIKNITYANSSNASWTGIYIVAGKINVGTVTGNTIGAVTGNSSILFTAGAGVANFYGINTASTSTIDCRNNTIGAITVANSASLSTHFYGINNSAAGTITLQSNLIGSTDAGTTNSINATSISTAAYQSVVGIMSNSGTLSMTSNTISKLSNQATHLYGTTVGIYVNGGTNTISNNTIRDLASAAPNTLATNSASCIGIAIASATTVQTVSSNTIYNLSSTYASASAIHIMGIYYAGSTVASTVNGNFIYNLSVNVGNTTANLYGIKIFSGATIYSNNLITLGGNTTSTIYGIYETGASSNNNSLYFNTVYVGGLPASGSLNSFALYSAVTTNTRNFRNNIFTNARSNNGATGKHYAAYFAYAVVTNLTLNYNDYYAPSTGGVLGFYNSADVSTIPLISTQDANSFAIDPVFANAGGTTASDYFISASLPGLTGTGITTDFYGTVRNVTPRMGAWEVNVVLPVTITSIKATKQNNPVVGHLPDIAVEWKVDNQINISAYEVEKSVDGLRFSKVATLQASGTNGASVTYNWLDINGVSGHNYYRVRSIGFGGYFKYSTIENVNLGNTNYLFAVYPNPVTNRLMNIQFTEMDKGVYRLRLINTMGQPVFVTELTHTGGSVIHKVKLGYCAAGNYQLEIVNPINTRMVIAVVVYH